MPDSAETTSSRGAELAERGLESHAPARLNQVLAAHAAKLGIVADEVGELASLLDEIAAGKTGDFVLETGNAKELAQHITGVVIAQRLIEIRGQPVRGSTMRKHAALRFGRWLLLVVAGRAARPRRVVCLPRARLASQPC
jgi:hypothetical protein